MKETSQLTTPEPKSSTPQEDSNGAAGKQTDPIMAVMHELGGMPTRARYIALNWLNPKYKPSPEEEAEMPEQFRLPVIEPPPPKLPTSTKASKG